MSLSISMKDLLESGVHFGHRTNRWDPRMKSYIFTERNGIHIIDLQQTVQSLEKFYVMVRDKIADGGTILLVGTKRQAQETIQIEAERCGMPYVMERWLPGTITNWVTIHQRIMELDRLEKMRDTGEIDRLVKKEGLMIERKIKRLLVHLSGIRHMNGLPDMLFVVDVMRESTAVHEANLKTIPIVAMVDTNCNPNNIDYVIPANDDAIRAIKLMVGKIADAVLEGKAMRKEEDLDKENLAPIGEDDGQERSRGRIALEEEVDDKDLLGEATLQKLANNKRETAEEEKKEQEGQEAGDDASEEEKPETDASANAGEEEKPEANDSANAGEEEKPEANASANADEEEKPEANASANADEEEKPETDNSNEDSEVS